MFSPEEQEILRKYRKENFAEKELDYETRRAMGKCPLTPEEVTFSLLSFCRCSHVVSSVGLSLSLYIYPLSIHPWMSEQVGRVLRAMGFDNSTRIFLATGAVFGGDRFLKPLQDLFPRIDNHSSLGEMEGPEEVNNGLLGSAVDYNVCLLSDIFLPTYDGPSNFANNLLGHRLYYGFRTALHPDRKGLAEVFIDRERGQAADFDARVRRVMALTNVGGPARRVPPESFFSNPWPECFCQSPAKYPADACPAEEEDPLPGDGAAVNGTAAVEDED